ncbi:MAG: hypothetical protein H7343_03690 [Undibacterium sp.]|nr:hypothetical protein [Opitutaceae bacterium]
MVVTIDSRRGGWKPMTTEKFRTYVEDFMVPARLKMVDEVPIFIPLSMTKDVASGILQSPAFLEQQRELARVSTVSMPVWRREGPDAGKIELLGEGYDVGSKIFTVPSAVVVRRDMPAAEAVVFLRALYKEFPFADHREDGTSRSLAVCISAMLSMFGAGLLGPLTARLHYMMTANTVGSGKSLLAKMAIVPVAGSARVRVKGENSEELRKELSTAALDGDSYFFLDDLDGVLKSQELNAFMTSATMSGRMLGGLSGFTAEKQCTVFITGNNLKPSMDIVRRTLRVSLYTEQFDVQERVVTKPIDEEWLCRPEVRSDVLSALWALIRDWDKAGRPKGGRVLRGFEKWCEVFGGIVQHAGFGDPCEAPPVDDNSGSNEIADMLALVEVLRADMVGPEGAAGPALRKKEFTFQDLVAACQANDCFSWCMEGTWKKDKESSEEWLELNQKSKSGMGRMFSEKFGGQVMKLKSGERVRSGQRGRKRHRRYVVEVVE